MIEDVISWEDPGDGANTVLGAPGSLEEAVEMPECCGRQWKKGSGRARVVLSTHQQEGSKP